VNRGLTCDGCKEICFGPVHYTFFREGIRVYLRFCDKCHDRILAAMSNLSAL